jgi:hypothetical protein
VKAPKIGKVRKVKFNVFNWSEVHRDKETQGTPGLLHVMCSDPQAAVFVEQEGYEVLAGVGSEVKLRIDKPYRFRVVCGQKHKVFALTPLSESGEADKAEFTNLDRGLLESGSVEEVRKAVRQFKLEQRAFRLAERKRKREEQMEQPSEPEPEEETETVEETETEAEASE